MARKAMVVKQQKKQNAVLKAIASGKKPVKSTQSYNICKICGRNGGYMRKFAMCRICFRELASQGLIPGVKKSSW